MLIPFEIDTESFETKEGMQINPDVKMLHENFLNMWLRCGILTYNGKNFCDSKLSSAIDAMPITLKKKWQAAISEYPRIKSSLLDWNGDISKEILCNIKEKPSVLIVEETKAYVDFEVPENDYSKIDKVNNIEVVKFKFCTQSEFFKQAQDKSYSHFEKSEPFDLIWKERFHWLAASENIRHISIVDRFAMINHLAWDSRDGISGLERFIRSLNTSATSKKYLKLFTSWSKDCSTYQNKEKIILSFIDSINEIMEKIPSKKIFKISIHVLHDGDFGKDSHDRHIRFGNMYIWDLGKGLACFDGNTCCNEKLTATFKTGLNIANEYIAKEFALEENRGRSHEKHEINF
jgi:hypothetical protein